MSNVNSVTDETYKAEVTDVKGFVLVDFWATWCGPCKMISPIIDELSKTMTDVKFLKAECDDAPEAAAAAEVRSIPSLVMYKDGEIHGKTIGAQSKGQLEAWIASMKAPAAPKTEEAPKTDDQK